MRKLRTPTHASHADVNEVVVAASPHEWAFADGVLTFFDARTLVYLGCASAGNKPEGIVFNGNGNVACVNEGSSIWEHNGAQGIHKDLDGSITVCDLRNSGNDVSINCANYPVAATNFAPGSPSLDVDGTLSPKKLQNDGVRLYGPSMYYPTHDLEPEGATFTADGSYVTVVFQDNSAYAVFDVTTKKYLFIKGFGFPELELDASDEDESVNIKSTWPPAVKVHGMYQPDVVASFTLGGNYYFVTANEGGARDGDEGLLGEAGDFEGEEIRLKDLDVDCATCSESANLGRLAVSPFTPSNFAAECCGDNSCTAEELHECTSDDHMCLYRRKDYGGGGNIGDAQSGIATHGSQCGYATMVAEYADTAAAAAGHNFHSWFTGPTGFRATLDVTTDLVDGKCEVACVRAKAAACQLLCDVDSDCDHFSLEYEHGVTECFLKESQIGATTDDGASCHEYVYYAQHYFDPAWDAFSGPASAGCVSPVVYKTQADSATLSHAGSPGGVYGFGSRSATIWSWDGSLTSGFVRAFDTGDDMERMSASAPDGICDGCTNPANEERCSIECPFNSDEAPPKLDDRSDAKGPEPECTATGVMSDGTTLMFVGMERTGGIGVYDVSAMATGGTPAMQDWLNVRNWLVGSEDPTDSTLLATGLNDGPESLVFISAAESPTGKELLLAASPMAGRVTVYTITKTDAWTMPATDGSCSTTASCPYLPTSVGGTGAALDKSFCEVAASGFAQCVTTTTNTTNTANTSAGDDLSNTASSTADSGSVSVGLVAGVLAGLLVLMFIAVAFAFKSGKSYGVLLEIDDTTLAGSAFDNPAYETTKAEAE